MTLIPRGKLNEFWPNGKGVYPRVEIQQWEVYQSGDSKRSHWIVRIFENENDDDPTPTEYQSWRDIDHAMTKKGFGPAFRKQFPTPEDRGREFLEELGQKQRGDETEES